MSGKNLIVAAAVAAVAGTASAVNASAILSYTYNNLSGSYTQVTPPPSPITPTTVIGTFTAVAVNAPPLRSSANVARNVAPADSAFFRPGFVTLDGGSFTISITVFNKGASTAQGSGTFTAIDINGDRITGTVDGVWSTNASGTFFNGTSATYNFINTSGDGEFNGSLGTLFHMADFASAGPLPGFLNQLFIAPAGNFFDSNFANIATTVTGQVLIPGPSALAALGVAGLIAGRRRRS
jgi:hypothetical protein